jgi:hypothetical protein
MQIFGIAEDIALQFPAEPSKEQHHATGARFNLVPSSCESQTRLILIFGE